VEGAVMFCQQTKPEARVVKIFCDDKKLFLTTTYKKTCPARRFLVVEAAAIFRQSTKSASGDEQIIGDHKRIVQPALRQFFSL